MLKINPVKPTIKLYRNNETRKLCSFVVPENKAGELNVNVKEDIENGGHLFITELRNRLNKLLGFEHLSHYNNNDNMTGLYIYVDPEYRQKHYFFGEILRLASIIQMLENKIKTFSIVSKDSAIYFHSKYKFQPSVTSFSNRDKLLSTLVNDKAPDFKDLSLKGKELTEQIKNNPSPDKQRMYCNDANQLFSQYINRALSNHDIKSHKFDWVMDMKLTRENVFANKEFYNELFKKHGIDYKI